MGEQVRLLTVLLCLSSLFSPLARADDSADEQARILYENGAMLYEEGRYEDAIAAWQEAYRLSQRNELLFNLANAEERAGRYLDALDHLNRYRAFAPAEERATLDRRITNLERRISESGSKPSTTTTAPATTAPPAQPEPKSEGGVRILPMVLFGVGGAGLVTGSVFGGRAVGARGDAAAACAPNGGLCTGAAATPLTNDRRYSLLADIGFGVGVAGVVGGVVTLLLPARDATASNYSLSTDGSGIYLRGNF